MPFICGLSAPSTRRASSTTAACTGISDMQTTLSPEFQATTDGRQAGEILRKCVHCGFCNATCPTCELYRDF